MPSNQQEALLNCECGCQPLYPCECRFDANVLIQGTATSSPSPCVIPIAGGSALQVEPVIATAIPEEIRMWHPDWVCRYMSTFTYKITAFPPNCIDPDTSRILVFVKKKTDVDWPGLDNDNLQIEEWYCVVYSSGAFGPVSLISINYAYTQCCKNETPTDPATSHLIWVLFSEVDFGPWNYNVKLTNQTTLATYGDCE